MAALSNYFLQPAGFYALAGLLALALFYLVKKQPEEEVMPSMAFFMERKKEGSLQHAFRRILHNLILLLQILIVLIFAVALAHPYLEQPADAENKVLVLDNSASMSNDLTEAKKFLKDNLGKSNTLIVANEEPRVVHQQSSSSTIRSSFEEIKSVDTKTDISSALKLARKYDGQIVFASDLDDSYQQIDVEEQLVEAEREFKTMDTEPKNSWGVTDMEVSKHNISVDIKNFKDVKQEISYEANGEERMVEAASGSVETVRFETVEGRNTLKLENDSLESDNSAYAYKPSTDKHDAVLFTDSGNRHFEKAMELIDFVDLKVVEPPVKEELDAEIYVVGDTDLIVSETLDSVEQEVRSGDSLIVFAQEEMESFGLKSLPVHSLGDRYNTSVEVDKPIKTSIETEVLDARKTEGSSLASPEEALVRSSEGKGDVLLYNIEDEDFRTNFLYPVFWKKVLEEMTERPEITKRNIETGDTIDSEEVVTPSGEEKKGLITVKDSGFYDTTAGVYAANLLDEDESEEESSSAVSDTGKSKEKMDVQNLSLLLLLLFITVEVAYLRYLGEI